MTTIRTAFWTILAIPVMALVMITSPLLWWLGREASAREPVDPDVDSDDPGVEV